jgi:hypothetical protein
MKLKTYETPQVDLLQINTEVNFCESNVTGGVPDMIVDPYTPTWVF